MVRTLCFLGPRAQVQCLVRDLIPQTSRQGPKENGKENKKRKSSVNFLFFMFREGHFEALASTLKANDFVF